QYCGIAATEKRFIRGRCGPSAPLRSVEPEHPLGPDLFSAHVESRGEQGSQGRGPLLLHVQVERRRRASGIAPQHVENQIAVTEDRIVADSARGEAFPDLRW